MLISGRMISFCGCFTPFTSSYDPSLACTRSNHDPPGPLNLPVMLCAIPQCDHSGLSDVAVNSNIHCMVYMYSTGAFAGLRTPWEFSDRVAGRFLG